MNIVAHYFESLEEFLVKNNNQEYLLLVATKTKIDLDSFRNKKLKVLGAIFPQIIFNNNVYHHGIIAIELNDNMKSCFIKDISKFSSLENESFKDVNSVIAILEGLSKHNEPFLFNLFERVDIHTNIMGAGAGFIEDTSKACLFDNNGFYKDSAILISLKNSIDLSVKHGWDYLEGPHIVTSCDGNILKTIDHRSAFEVYKEVIENDSGIILDESNFSEVSKNYPFGIVKYKGEQIVRDPIAVDGDSLILVGKVSNNSIVNILKGKNESLLRASKEAVCEVLKNDCEFILIFDCITRKSFLGDNFDEELDTIYKQTKAKVFVGAISIGEVANEGNKYINFLNKTCVIGGICF
jgi:hypothetical protein